MSWGKPGIGSTWGTRNWWRKKNPQCWKRLQGSCDSWFAILPVTWGQSQRSRSAGFSKSAIQTRYGENAEGPSQWPYKNKGLNTLHRAKTRKLRKMQARKRGKWGKCGWLALMWLVLGDPQNSVPLSWARRKQPKDELWGRILRGH